MIDALIVCFLFPKGLYCADALLNNEDFARQCRLRKNIYTTAVCGPCHCKPMLVATAACWPMFISNKYPYNSHCTYRYETESGEFI